MEIVLGTLELGAIGGAATYLLTAAEHLQRLGHEVTIFAAEVGGDMLDDAAGRGLLVVAAEDGLPEACDAIYAQDAATAYLLADRYPGTPQVFCLHSGLYDRWQPPQLPGVTGAVVVLNDRAARRVGALAHAPELIRLRQPVDTERFAPRGAISDPPRRVLLLGNYLRSDRRDLIVEACAEAELECRHLGLRGEAVTKAPETEINQADIVIGHGRVIVEAMACGRAAYVYDHGAGDGWVTPERYATLESENFAGPGRLRPVTVERLREDLRAYRREMGPVNRDLVMRHHSAGRHARELVELLRGMAGPDRPPDGPMREMARLARVQWQTESRALGAAREAEMLRDRVLDAEARAAEAEGRLAALRGTRRFRFAAALARPLDRLRRNLRRGRGPA